jgi:tetratricopeptide (TPR) repeat protein
MSLKDPAGLAQRIPELEALAVDPKIRRAIESGDPFKVYRALGWAKWLKRLPAHQETLKTLVRQRRLFAKPLNGSPALATINSAGFSFVGSSEKENDGTYIAMHAFVVLYLIPIIPLRSYLVRKVDSSLFSSKWNIFARVPSSMLGWLYSRTLALGLVVMVGSGAVGSIIKSRTQDVVVVNGFDVPVNVVLDGTQRTIAPLGRDTITVKAGVVQGKASAKGIDVDMLQQKIASSGSTTIWNIAGAAPVFQEQVVYTKHQASSSPAQPEPTIYCGQRFVEIEHVDDPFTPPPQSVSMGKHTEQVHRTHLDLAKAGSQPGYLSCMYYMAAHDGLKNAARFLEAEAELKGWDSETTAMAMAAASLASNAEAIRVAQRALKIRPDDIILHRRYQAARDDAGQTREVLQEYADMARRDPDSAKAQYLYAALMHGQAGVDSLEKLAARFGKEPHILRSLTWRRMVHGDYAGTIDGWNRLRSFAPGEAAEVVDAQVRALVARQRAPEAARVLAALLNAPQDDSRAVHLAEYLMVVGLAGGDPRRQVDSIAKEASADGRIDHVLVRAGLEPVAAGTQQTVLVQLMLALRSDPAAAMRLAKRMTQGDVMQLGPEQWGLLYAEAVRSKDQAVVEKLDRLNRGVDQADRATLKRYVQGEQVSLEDSDLEPGLRAAAMLVRSRNASLPAAERAQLRARAAQTDLLHSVVTRALAKWPA